MSYEIALQRIERWKARKRWNSWLDLSHCNLMTIPPLPDKVKKLNLSVNRLNNLRGIPPSVKKLYCSQNELYNLYDLPPKLKMLVCCSNDPLKNVDILVNSIKYLNISYCDYITETLRLPQECHNLTLRCCSKLKTIQSFPPKLRMIECDETGLRYLPPFPNTLQYFRAHFCKLQTIPTLPDSLHILIIISYRLSKLPKLPQNITVLDVTGNRKLDKQLQSLVYPDSLEVLEIEGYHFRKSEQTPVIKMPENRLTKIYACFYD